MSTTPGTQAKLSPFGSGIRKTLLTPCRRVGLSRNKKTHNSLPKLSQNLNNSLSQSCTVTPVNKKASIKRKGKTDLSSPVEKTCKLENSEKQESTVKKSLNKCFNNQDREHTTKSKEKKIVKSENSIKQGPKTDLTMVEDEESEQVVSKDPKKEECIHKEMGENIPNIDEISCTPDDASSTSSGPVMKKSHKFRIMSDSDDDSTPPNEPKLNENRISEKEILIERNVSYNIDNVDKHRECKVSLPKFSEDDVANSKNKQKSKGKLIEKTTNKKPQLLEDDDEDFEPFGLTQLKENTKMLKLKSRSSSNSKIPEDTSVKNETNSGKPKEKKLKSNNAPKTLIKKFSSLVETLYDDEDAFISTPDREKNERKELVDKIKDLESKIKLKKEKLDNLKRAAIYKTKHNVNDLTNLAQQWKQGCIVGLNDLLEKLQQHGPMNMPMLLKNLRIPDDIISRLFLNTPIT